MLIAASVDICCIVAASFMQSFTAFCALFIFGQAFCNGMSYMAPVQLAWKSFPEKSGLASGIIIGGFGFGGLVFSYVSTMLVNPLNEGQVV